MWHERNGVAMLKDTGYTVNTSGQRKLKKTIHGWKIKVEFRNGTTTWTKMKSAKEANSVELAEYDVVNKIGDEPAFAW